ncbi:MAG: hypothetical protein QG608_2760, partial [Actinomycetota bacterium]|nr:hypothetical protein [Actinomycetota bacterium]
NRPHFAMTGRPVIKKVAKLKDPDPTAGSPPGDDGRPAER